MKIESMNRSQVEQLLNDLVLAQAEMSGGFTESALQELEASAEKRLAQLDKEAGEGERGEKD